MELIIHDLDDEKLENLKWKIEKKEKIMYKIKYIINQRKIIVVWDVLNVGLKLRGSVKLGMDMKV